MGVGVFVAVGTTVVVGVGEKQEIGVGVAVGQQEDGFQHLPVDQGKPNSFTQSNPKQQKLPSPKLQSSFSKRQPDIDTSSAWVIAGNDKKQTKRVRKKITTAKNESFLMIKFFLLLRYIVFTFGQKIVI